MSTQEPHGGRTVERWGRWVRRGSSIALLDPMFERRQPASGVESERAPSVDIRWLQAALNRILGTHLAVDGNIGGQTRAAIRRFQASRGLTVDGIAGSQTIAALRRVLESPPATLDSAAEELVGFGFNDHRVRPHHLPQIQRIAHAVVGARRSGRPVDVVRIVGHTDPVGDDADNLALGRRRADEVAQSLRTAIAKLDAAESRRLRFDIETRGESQPIPGGPERNRRVQVFAKPPARPRPRGGGGPALAKEHVIVVGGPSNFYNGFGRFNASGSFVLSPAPKDLAGVRDFCHPSLGNITHDLYWANFIEPVPRLFTQRIAKPVDGDVVTILVYWPPYAQRSSLDWDSSPWNSLAWRASPWVAGKDPYDPTVRKADQGTFRPPSVPTTPRASKRPIVNFATQPVSEARIDHEILMRCTTEARRPGQTYDMRPSRPSEWMDDVHDLARRIVFGPLLGGRPVLPAVLVKLLIVDDPKQILDYLARGTFPDTERWTHVLDTRDEEDMGNMTGPTVGVREGQWWDVAAAGKKGFRPPPWWTAPHISRKQITVKRFDYIGHSNEDAFFLKYAWANRKGDPAGPVGEVLLSTSDLDAALRAAPSRVFGASATAHLWGCSLGLGMAPTLSNHVSTVAAEVLTDYEGLVVDPKAMPTPIGGGWITYLKPITVPARP